MSRWRLLTACAVGLVAQLGAAGPAAARAAITVVPGTGVPSSHLAVVVEEDTNRISVFRAGSDGAVLVARFGGKGAEPGRFSRPYGAVVEGGTIWVTDRLNSRIQAFDTGGGFLRALDLPPPPGGRAPEPGAPALGRDGHLIVPDLANDQLMVVSTTGQVMARWGRSGSDSGEFMQPVAVAVSPVDGRIYTVEAFQPRLQMFDPTGRWLGQLTGSGRLVKPTKVAVDGDGRLYVADEALNQILRLTSADEVDLAWGGYGSQPGAFFLPEGLAVDGGQRLWVVDHGNHRGQVLSPDGKPLFLFAAGEIGVVPGALPVKASSASRQLSRSPDLAPPVVVAAVAVLAMVAFVWSSRRRPA